MRSFTFVLSLPLALLFMGSQAHAASCSTFAVIKSYDAGASAVTLKTSKGSQHKYFPKPEGAPSASKIPKQCKSSILKKQPNFPVTATGGRLSVTQVRMNFSGKMLNDTDDKSWLPAKLQELIESKQKVVVVMRPPVGKKKPYGVTTIYLPITQAERDEIERLENQAEDV